SYERPLMLNSREFSPLKTSNLTLPVWLGFIISQRAEKFLNIISALSEIAALFRNISAISLPFA
ncbi:MAG: hypothetical protein COX41_04265, partial [Candidatus Omnitrophica bacterium CG23_combo_of_CG06-09_8_20_14_all_41_10]